MWFDSIQFINHEYIYYNCNGDKLTFDIFKSNLREHTKIGSNSDRKSDKWHVEYI